MARVVLLAAFIVAAAASANLRAESLASKNRKGNRLFDAGKYAEAENAYLDAQVKNPGRPEVLYNLGNSLIRQKKFDQGTQSLLQAAGKGDARIRQHSWYNTGNALFETGKYKDAATAYIRALELDPSDRDAKHNLELALLRQKAQEQAGKEQPQGGSGDSGRDPSSGGEGNRPQDKPRQQDRGGSGGGQDPADAAERPGSEQKPRPGAMSREQAVQILDAVRAQELEEQRKLLERQARRESNGKDW